MQQHEQTAEPLTLFYSYANEDEPLREQLEKHLRLLSRQGLLSEWHNRQIVAGTEWAQEIDTHLETASMILLLVSPDFLASDYCYAIEMQRALERHARSEAHVIPVILRPCEWREAPFAHVQVLPRDGKPVTEWDNLDAAFLNITQGIRRVISQQIPSAHSVLPLSSVDRQNRLRLLKRVRRTWIEGVLEQSLHQAALIALDLQERPDALDNPWHLEVQETNRPPRLLPAGTSIVQVCDEADGELLILGEPGAGKTTLLLQLARTLLERAEQREHHPLPVIFNLSTWAEKRLPLSDWLVEELRIRYQTPHTLGTTWVTTDQILPLLDGLDEVGRDACLACVQAINTYYQRRLEKGLAPLVICCRSEDYAMLPTRVTLHQAVSIQPLTEEQIEDYFRATKGQIEVLWQALHHDPELYELARRPLMLSIFTLAYRGATQEDLPAETTREAQQQQVFATYVERMLTRRGVPKRFSRKQTLRWLTFLATTMSQRHQTVFYLEHLQPEWLRGRGRRLLYRLSVGPLVGLVAGLVTGLISELVLVFASGPFMRWLVVLIGLFVGLLVGLIFGLVFGVALGLGQIRPREVLTRSWKGTKQSIIVGLLVGLVFILFAGLVSIQFFPTMMLDLWKVDSVFEWVGWLVVVLAVVLFVGLLVGSIVGLTSGFSMNQPDDRMRLVPNQGIWHSARNGLLVGLLVGVPILLLVGLVSGLPIPLLVGMPTPLVLGLLVGLPVALASGLASGLGAFFQHFTLRLWLWQTGSLPWNLIAFLNDAAKRLLLRKVGGGYIFIHRLLLDYFAALEKKEP